MEWRSPEGVLIRFVDSGEATTTTNGIKISALGYSHPHGYVEYFPYLFRIFVGLYNTTIQELRMRGATLFVSTFRVSTVHVHSMMLLG